MAPNFCWFSTSHSWQKVPQNSWLLENLRWAVELGPYRLMKPQMGPGRSWENPSQAWLHLHTEMVSRQEAGNPSPPNSLERAQSVKGIYCHWKIWIVQAKPQEVLWEKEGKGGGTEGRAEGKEEKREEGVLPRECTCWISIAHRITPCLYHLPCMGVAGPGASERLSPMVQLQEGNMNPHISASGLDMDQKGLFCCCFAWVYMEAHKTEQSELALTVGEAGSGQEPTPRAFLPVSHQRSIPFEPSKHIEIETNGSMPRLKWGGSQERGTDFPMSEWQHWLGVCLRLSGRYWHFFHPQLGWGVHLKPSFPDPTEEDGASLER